LCFAWRAFGSWNDTLGWSNPLEEDDDGAVPLLLLPPPQELYT
jgi:hypothetical protein